MLIKNVFVFKRRFIPSLIIKLLNLPFNKCLNNGLFNFHIGVLFVVYVFFRNAYMFIFLTLQNTIGISRRTAECMERRESLIYTTNF